ncbi:hypothetical protein Vadar_015383 [Vaccinium darrowii]|uniref:Uncharacterized protein n=1 Tax=Vaccinium darrowii TaxID=229202 RepID=A0ACB7XHP0_9ERIC|nr:hypothetical protein Vadar_015383 [Vaccinium darrowii]
MVAGSVVVPRVLDQHEIELFPLLSFQSNNTIGFGESNCVICFDEFVDRGNVRALPCRHIFHPDCIDSWLTSRSTKCLVCRRVERVKGSDDDSKKLTVIDNVDPVKLREMLEMKTNKKEELVAPQPKKDKDEDKNGGDNKQEKKSEKEKFKELNMHCQGCIEKLRKAVAKTKGSATASTSSSLRLRSLYIFELEFAEEEIRKGCRDIETSLWRTRNVLEAHHEVKACQILKPAKF